MYVPVYVCVSAEGSEGSAPRSGDYLLNLSDPNMSLFLFFALKWMDFLLKIILASLGIKYLHF